MLRKDLEDLSISEMKLHRWEDLCEKLSVRQGNAFIDIAHFQQLNMNLTKNIGLNFERPLLFTRI